MQKPWTVIQEVLLCERVNRGSADAFAEVYDRYAPRLYKHLALRTSQKEVAEDLLSKVFLKVWEYVRGGKELRYLQSFLYTVTNNILTDHYRRNAHAPLVVEDITLFDTPVPNEIIPPIDATFNRKVIEEALTLVKPEFRDVLIMRYIDDLSLPEMTKILGTTSNAIYVRMHRALKAVRAVLDTKYAP